MIIDNKLPSSFFILLAIVMAPFTQLRISFFGISEIILMIFFIISFKLKIERSVLKKCIFTQFWLLYLFVSVIGFSFNIIILDYKTGTLETMIFDFSSYVFILIVCFFFERLFLENKLDPLKLICYFYYSITVFLSLLYLVSIFSNSIFGFSLRYYGSFSPLVTNIHQAAMVIVTLPFIGLFVLNMQTKFLHKFITIILIVFTIIMSLDTAATKAIMAIVFAMGVYCLLLMIKITGKRIIPIYFLLFVMLVLYLIHNINVIGYMEGFFIENDGGGARAILYLDALNIGLTSPLFGLGAGSHVILSGKFYDSHQTYLTIFLQTGLIGLFAYFLLIFKIISKVIFSPAFLAVFTTILIYSLGGDVLRRLPIWIILLLIYYASQKKTTHSEGN